MCNEKTKQNNNSFHFSFHSTAAFRALAYTSASETGVSAPAATSGMVSDDGVVGPTRMVLSATRGAVVLSFMGRPLLGFAEKRGKLDDLCRGRGMRIENKSKVSV